MERKKRVKRRERETHTALQPVGKTPKTTAGWRRMSAAISWQYVYFLSAGQTRTISTKVKGLI